MRKILCVFGFVLLMSCTIPAENTAMDSFLFSVEGRFGFFDMTNSSKSFHAVYGTGAIKLGGGFKVLHRSGFFGRFDLEASWKSGEKVYVTDTGFTKTGVETNISIIPLTFSAGMQFLLDNRLSPYAGGGIGAYSWSEEDDRKSNFGYHILGGVDYALNDNFYINGEFRWSFVPNAIGELGVSAFYDETDIGGISIVGGLGYRFK